MLSSICGNPWKLMRLSSTRENSICSKSTHAFMRSAEAMVMASETSKMGDQYGNSSDEDSSIDSNEFKAVFKKYKKRRPRPDLSEVIDVKTSPSMRSIAVFEGASISPNVAETANRLGLIHPSLWKAYSFSDRPGLYILPGLLKKSESTKWLARTFKYARPPNVTNLTLHEKDIVSNPQLINKGLRWTTLGVEYDWNTKQYPPDGRALPEECVQLGNLISSSLNLGEMRPDATIVNYYPPKSALSPHVDRSERSSAPLISMSLGQSAVYLSGALTLSEAPIPIWLRNGDFLVMHADQRLVYHAIPCIVPESQVFTEDDADDSTLRSYLNCSRVNITIRQVNP